VKGLEREKDREKARDRERQRERSGNRERHEISLGDVRPGDVTAPRFAGRVAP